MSSRDDEEKKPPYHHNLKPPPTYHSTNETQQFDQQQHRSLELPPPLPQHRTAAATAPYPSTIMMNPLQLAYDNEHALAVGSHSNHGLFKADDERIPFATGRKSSASRSDSIASSMTASSAQQQQVDDSSSSQQHPAVQLEGVSPTDVLCGRDKVSHAHVGNKSFRKLIEKHRATYQSAPSREVKTQITCQVIETIHRNSGRFLKLDEATGRWDEVSDQYAREKVSHALRSAKDPHRPKVKKRRQMKEYVPTPEEESLFKEALADQQQIFQSMIAKYQQQVEPSDSLRKDAAQNVDNDDDDDDDKDDPFDFEFYN